VAYRMGRGDYYRGDYYRGGILSGLGSIVKGAVKTGFGFITGGPGGAAKALVGHAKSELAPTPLVGTSLALNTTSAEELVRQHQVNVHKQQAAIAAGGGVGVMPPMSGSAGLIGPGGGLIPRGYHLNKSPRYPTAGYPAGSKLVRNRSMNMLNPRALRRAIRRTQAFARIAMKAIHIVHPKKKGSFGGFRKKRR